MHIGRWVNHDVKNLLAPMELNKTTDELNSTENSGVIVNVVPCVKKTITIT